MIRRVSRLLLTLVVCAACRSSEPAPAADPGGERVVEGAIAVAGTAAETWTTLVAEDGSSLYLTGGLESELRRLGGARVRAAGLAGAGAPGPSMVVGSYEILAIDGAVPWVGTVAAADGGWWLATPEGERLELAGAGPVADGARIWVTGERTGDTVHVHAHGVLREP